MPEAWIILLRGVTSRQIKNGLNSLSDRGSPFPPNGSEFRNMCLGITIDKNGNDTTHQHKSCAHIGFGDPRHPGYEKKLIENATQKEKRRAAAHSALGSLKELF